MSNYTTNLVSKAGGSWQVLKWENGEWTQVGPYFDTEREAEVFIQIEEQK
jgi:hypothetical protein